MKMEEDQQSKSKRKRTRRRKPKTENKSLNQKETINKKIDEEDQQSTAKRIKSQGVSKSSSFLDKMRARLSGGHFRMINEKLYTSTGDEALNYFKEDPALFSMYHTGYQEQMLHWPEQPVNIIIKWLKDHNPSLVVADFGCGDARLARNVKNKVISFDLVSNDPSVIACDMSNEAHRVLKPSGWLLIAEVKSRFDPNTGVTLRI